MDPPSADAMDMDDGDIGTSSGQLGSRVYNDKVKANAYLYVFTLAMSILEAAHLQLNAELLGDLRFSGRLEGAISTLHNQLRKKKNGNQMDETKFAALKATLTDVYTAQMGDALKIYEKHGLSVDYLTVCPIVNMLTSFKLVKDEVRVGVTQITPKKGLKDKKVSVSSYGLSAHHAPYLKMVTLKPERRSGLMMCIGPLAHCIGLLEDKQYQQKSSRALREELKHLPMKEAIIECCQRGTKASIGGVLGALGDVLLLTTDRTHCKMTPPIITFLVAMRVGSAGSNPRIEADKLSKWFDFSGKGAMIFYNELVAGRKFTWPSDETSTVLSAEVFFHSCFGTHFEDLGVLSSITNVNSWHKRKDMSKVFTSKDNKIVEFTAPSFRYVSKLISACGTKMLGTVQPMIQAKPTFSGSRKRLFSEMMRSTLENTTTGAFDSSPLSLTRALMDLKSDLLKNPSPEFGTTTWFEVENVTRESWGEASDFVAEENGQYFYS